RPARDALTAAGLSPADADAVLHDAYAPDRVNASIRATARHTVRLFEDVGALDVPGGRDAFHAAELLP
ncbi:hypothetical protein, partial [Streptomyces sp. URMC 129]|uniref:hypothetical protein n=1 Tax=Streptomyces sp. URMC 129 TaxID=3423407 RepID=UPI003F1CA277